jgi:hypothetical protein
MLRKARMASIILGNRFLKQRESKKMVREGQKIK